MRMAPGPNTSAGGSSIGPAGEPDTEAMDLARRASAGDDLATSHLLRILAPRVGAVVRAILGTRHPDCDDALQLSLIGFVRALPAFRGECDPAGYASTIAVRTAVAARKRARVREAQHDSAGAALAEGDSPADRIASQRRREILHELLASIPTEQGETLAMRVVLGWSLEEIAAHTGAPVNTVRSRLRLAKDAMRRRIEHNPAIQEELEVDP
jgi:RNA polymerase sigma factor (sigma-70 family)